MSLNRTVAFSTSTPTLHCHQSAGQHPSHYYTKKYLILMPVSGLDIHVGKSVDTAEDVTHQKS